MRTSSIRNIRRAELSSAAFEAVIKYGLRKTTLEKVGNLAGVSKGVVLHHFKDKSSLLEAVFRRSNTVLTASLVELYRHAESPLERLWAIMTANFSEAIYNQRVCQAWVSLAAEVPHSRQCQRIQTACNERIHSNLRHELKHFIEYSEVKKSAMQLGLLIDGIWIRGGLTLTPLTSTAALDEMEYAIFKLLPDDPDSIALHRMARAKMANVAVILLGSTAYRERTLQPNRGDGKIFAGG